MNSISSVDSECLLSSSFIPDAISVFRNSLLHLSMVELTPVWTTDRSMTWRSPESTRYIRVADEPESIIINMAIPLSIKGYGLKDREAPSHQARVGYCLKPHSSWLARY